MWSPALVAAVVMLIVGFFFATVSGNLVGMIGSSNNPISGLDAFDADHRGAADGRRWVCEGQTAWPWCWAWPRWFAFLPPWRASCCRTSRPATSWAARPRTIQIVELIAVVLASLVMYFPLYILQVGNIKSGGTGFGDPKLAAPQAGLMAVLAQGIVGGDMPWPLVVTGNSFRHWR